MKRICVFYHSAGKWIGKPIRWIVCKECHKKILRGHEFRSLICGRRKKSK